MDVLGAGDQKKLSQRLPSVWGRWEAGWDYYHYRFTGMHAPRTSACLSRKLEFPEVVSAFDVCAWVAASMVARGGWAESTRSRDA